MAESIELKSYRVKGNSAFENDSEIEEYHEINAPIEETYISPIKTFTEYDFFTQEDVKITNKTSIKKRKNKKPDRPRNLMDIINFEMASMVIPIKENVISIESNFNKYDSYLENPPNILHTFYKSETRYLDSEFGYRKKETAHMTPVYPKIESTINTADEKCIPVQYMKPDNYIDIITEYSNNTKTDNAKFLYIELRNLIFKHHHSFSLEKFVGIKLIQFYDEYIKVKETLERIKKDIKINRDTRDNLKRELISVSPNTKENVKFDENLRRLTKNIINLKDVYLINTEKQKELIHQLISLWLDIEMIREKSQFKETPFNLIITRTVLGDDEFEKKWNEVFDVEFNDILDTIEYEYVNKYLEYKEAKYTQNLDDSAKRKISKPKLHFDEGELKEEVEAIVNKIVLKDPIEIILRNDGSFIKKANKFKPIGNSYLFHVYVDSTFVCESEVYSLTNSKVTNIDLTEAFSVQILPKNSFLSIILLENDKEVACMKVNLSEINKNISSSEFVTHNLVFNEIFEPNAKNIGSGYSIKEIATANKVRLKSSNLFKGNLYSNCNVLMKLGWNEKLNENESEHIKRSMELGRQIKRLQQGKDKADTSTLCEVISKLYDKDVSNDEPLINNLKNTCKGNINHEETFKLEENNPEFVRFKLLHLRNTGNFVNIENKLIPQHASQISTEQLMFLQKSVANDFEAHYYSEKYAEMDPIELQRFVGSKYVQKLNTNLLKNLNEHLLRKTHKDVVRDFKDLSLRSFLTQNTSLALANLSTCTKQQLLNEELSKEQDIQVTVVRAFNLMDRIPDVMDEGCEETIAGFKVRPLRPFVKISYRGVSVQTASAIGCHPTWNQTVKMTTRLDPLSSIHINIFDEYRFPLDSLSDSEHSLSRTVRYRHQSRWLGTIEVPLHAVLTLGTVRGTFKILIPPMLFGYESYPKETSQSLIPEVTQLLKKDTAFISLHITTSLIHLGGLHEYTQPSTDDDYLINHLNNFVTEHVNDFPSRNIYLTSIDSSGRNKCVTQFLQPIPLPDLECFPKHPKFRLESALSKSSGMSKSSSSSGRRREEEKLSTNNGEEKESIYSTNEASWKSGENQLTKLVNAALRYVALIPTYELSESHIVTLIGLELVKVLYGSPLDHTILLASYFLHLGIRCYIAIGLGLPRGTTSYVLTKYDMALKRVVLTSDVTKNKFLTKCGYVWHVYDATSGERSELRDVGCPLKTVDYVFDNENIWVNIQSSQDCESVSFDLSRSSDWQQVFDKSMLVLKLPIARELSYSPAADVDRLRTSLEDKIRDKVCRWRPHTKTIWNRYCSTLLREMLLHWEYWSFNPSDPRPAPGQRLKQLLVTYKMYGFPINLPYSSTKSVISTVKSTGLHCLDDSNVEFGLAVEVFAYPNNVISVWVFFVSITRL